MRRNFLSLGAVAAAVLQSASVHGQPASSPWPMFHRDPERTGSTPDAGPMIPMLSWSYRTAGNVSSSPAINPEWRIYVGSEDANFYSLGEHGSFLWSYRTGDKIWQSSPAIDKDGRLCAGSWDNNLYVLSSNGSLSWSYRTSWHISSSPVIGSSGLIYVGSHDASLYAFYPWGQNKFASPSVPGRILSSPAVRPDATYGEMMYMGS